MACNLIRPLGSTHNFTQSGRLILFIPDHLSGQNKLGKPPNTLYFSELLRSRQTSYCLLFSSSSITPPRGKPSNLWTPCVYSLRPRVPSWIWIRWIQYTTHRNNSWSSPVLAMSTAMQNSLWCVATSSLGNIFWRHSRFSPKQPKPQIHGWLHRFCPQTANDFCYTMASISPSYIQQCLNLTMHFSLRHLAAKMLSQLYNYFISFPYFFPSYET